MKRTATTCALGTRHDLVGPEGCCRARPAYRTRRAFFYNTQQDYNTQHPTHYNTQQEFR